MENIFKSGKEYNIKCISKINGLSEQTIYLDETMKIAQDYIIDKKVSGEDEEEITEYTLDNKFLSLYVYRWLNSSFNVIPGQLVEKKLTYTHKMLNDKRIETEITARFEHGWLMGIRKSDIVVEDIPQP